jgi:hypothetical protein
MTDNLSNPPTQARKKVWLVFVRDVGAEHVALVQRYGFQPTKKRGIFWRQFDSIEHATHMIQPFKAAGLHGVIKNRWKARVLRPYKPRCDGASPFAASNHYDFGKVSRSSGYSAAPKSGSNPRRRGRGRRGM